MWNPVKIEFENLFSHKHSEYTFAENQCVVIFGKNLSDKSLDNNGAGKTTLFEAIALALTGDSLRGVKKESFINRVEDVCNITFELYNAALRTKLVIKRTFSRNKTSVVEIWENDNRNTQAISVNDANKRILELLGITREDLLRYFIIGQDNDYTFFTASDTDKKEVMNRITSADAILPVIAEIQTRLSDATIEYNKLLSDYGAVEGKKDILEEQKKEIIENDNSKCRIENAERKIENEKKRIAEYENNIELSNANIVRIQKQLSSVDIICNIDELTERRKQMRSKISEIEDNISENKRVRSKLNTELSGAVSCPNCGEVFIPDSELGISIEDTKRMLEEVTNEIDKQNKVLDKYNTDIKKLTVEINNCEEQINIRNNNLRKMKQEQALIETSKYSIRASNELIDKYKHEINEIKEEAKNNKVIISMDEKIKECRAKMTELSKKIAPVEKTIEMIKFWQFNMGKNGFTTYLANRSVKIIEGVTNSYLRKFGSDISVMINGFKVLKSGEIKEKIDVFVSTDGITAEPFMAKSGGERARVTLAGILGIQHLINLSTDGRGLNLLILDEALSGIDSNGTLEIIKTIDNMNSSVLMITQNIEDPSICKHHINVVKENGVSRYV